MDRNAGEVRSLAGFEETAAANSTVDPGVTYWPISILSDFLCFVFLFRVFRGQNFFHESHETDQPGNLNKKTFHQTLKLFAIRENLGEDILPVCGGFVYRLGREILILERRVRFPYLLPNKRKGKN